MVNKEVILKVILNDKRKTKMKVKEVLGKNKYMLIDGSIVEGNEISEVVKEKV